jgi:outer membrane receptor for ferrienterochelin and colicins
MFVVHTLLNLKKVYMKLFFTGFFLCCALWVQAQGTLTIIVKSEAQPLPNATVLWKTQNRSFITDSSGKITIQNIPAGKQTFMISYIGYSEKEIELLFPLPGNDYEVVLEEEEEEEEEIIVTATRTSRTIANTPTRTEVISGEELSEKANMKPGDIRMLLNESTGIQAQQTSATSYNSSIRIQGLDGRYTQLLKDGLPLYAGFSGGLSLLQIVPLDLQQVEVIKGSSSTLYGGGAIAGLVNLVSKTPREKRELLFLSNFTSAGGLDLSGFYSQKFTKTGYTVFASRNTGRAYDPAGNGFTAIPEFERYTINPRMFLYGKKTQVNFGISYVTENRTGGSMDYIRKGTAGYYEKNQTNRFTTQLDLTHEINQRAALRFKNSYSRFRRNINTPGYVFAGVQQSSFSELTYHLQREKIQWVFGANLVTDDFTEDAKTAPVRDYHYNTPGWFVQNTWGTGRFSLETGLRGDYTAAYGFSLLPRISAVYKTTDQLTLRAGAGMGYKTPTVFNEESERIHYENILPITAFSTVNERSVGYNVDINYRIRLGKLGISLNQLFFYTKLDKPLLLVDAGNGNSAFQNANGHMDTKGFETNLKMTWQDFKLFVGYTYADVSTHYNNVRALLPLAARNRLNNVLMYEKENNLKIGLEAYYVGEQLLSDNTTGRSYWTAGFMVEKFWNKFSVFINFENFTDVRQTKFGPIYTGPASDPIFKDIYAPVDGFVVNGGIKLKL